MDELADLTTPVSTASPRLFENAFLDKLSRIHPVIPPLIYLPLVLGLFLASLRMMSWQTAMLGMAAGYVAWTLVEYLGHRFLFHLDFPGVWGKRIHYLIHGVHHVHPGDPLRLVMPILLSAPIMAVALLILRLMSGRAIDLALWGGFILGYVGYDMVHFYVHHARPSTRLGQLLRRRHLLHHFRDSKSSFGVSAPWWDHVFGTAPAKSLTRSWTTHSSEPLG
jgi:sterol desaturase/sphingolipid hydroxylase (fatty acid hydroxylase superfamily)